MLKKSSIIKILKEGRPYWLKLIGLVFLMLCSGVFKSLSAGFMGDAVDSGIALNTPEVLRCLCLAILMYLCDAVRLWLFNMYTAKSVDRMFLDIKVKAFEKISHSRLSDCQKQFSGGDLLSRVTGDIPRLAQNFADTFTWLLSVLFRGMISLIFCIGLSWQLSAVYVITLPILLWITDKVGKPIQSFQNEAAKKSGKTYSMTNEMLNNNEVLKSFTAEQAIQKRFDLETENQKEMLDRAAKRGTLLTAAAYLSDVLLIAAVFIYGCYLISAGCISVGSFVSFVALTGSIREMFSLIDRGTSTIRESEALAGRVCEVLDLPSEEISDHERPAAYKGTVPKTAQAAILEMKDLTFSYNAGAPVLRGISIHVSKGQKIGIIGPSGSGKTTIINLICGFYRAYEGEFNIFGEAASTIPLSSLRKRIAVVPQGQSLFRGSIAENVRYGKLDADMNQIERALSGARLFDSEKELKEGASAEIGDMGSKLSGGQKQRIAIARALVRDAELVLLDEASSALDAETEFEIQETMEEAFQDKTVVVISHRYASVAHMDWVYCLNNGRIVEEGKPDELMQKNSFLKRMAINQAGKE